MRLDRDIILSFHRGTALDSAVENIYGDGKIHCPLWYSEDIKVALALIPAIAAKVQEEVFLEYVPTEYKWYCAVSGIHAKDFELPVAICLLALLVANQ
jgi:hypothetical protein